MRLKTFFTAILILIFQVFINGSSYQQLPLRIWGDGMVARSMIKKYEQKLQDNNLLKTEDGRNVLLFSGFLDMHYEFALKLKNFINATFPTNNKKHIYCIGQSFAWLTYMMEEIDKVQGNNDYDYRTIAFSGNIGSDRAPWFKALVRNNYSQEGLPQVELYRLYLEECGMEECIQKKEPVICIDYVHSGYSLSSFYAVMPSSIKNDINFVVTPYGVPDPDKDLVISLPPRSSIMNFFEETDCIMPDGKRVRYLKPGIKLHDKLDELGGVFDAFNLRLVMNYPFQKWAIEEPSEFQISETAIFLQMLMKDFIARKVALSSMKLSRDWYYFALRDRRTEETAIVACLYGVPRKTVEQEALCSNSDLSDID